MFTTAHIADLLAHYGYAMLLPVATMEGPLVSILAGMLVSLGILDAWISFAVLMAGDMLGDTLYYTLGRFGRRKEFPRWYRFIGITEERVHRLEKFFKAHDWKILFFAKTQAIGSVILFSAGFAHMNYKKYMFYNILGSLPKVAIFLSVGYFFTQGYAQVDGYVNAAGIFSVMLGVTLLIGYFVFKHYFNSTELLDEKAQ